MSLQITFPQAAAIDKNEARLNAAIPAVEAFFSQLGFSSNTQKIHRGNPTAKTVAKDAMLLEMGNTYAEAQQLTVEIQSSFEEIELRLGSQKRQTKNTERSNILALLQKMKDSLANENQVLRANPWKTLPYTPEMLPPANAEIIGNGGRYGPWDDAPFYQLTTGNVLYIDHENKEALEIPNEELQLSLQILGEFHPSLPEGSKSIANIIQEIKEKVEKQVRQEAAEGKTITIEQFGFAGTPHFAADHSLHFVPYTPKKSRKERPATPGRPLGKNQD